MVLALLDTIKPGWFHQIDLEQLKLSSCSKCILGQLFGEFELGLRNLDLDNDLFNFPSFVSAGYGFTISRWEPIKEELDRQFALLQEAWVELIQMRKLLSCEAESIPELSVPELQEA